MTILAKRKTFPANRCLLPRGPSLERCSTELATGIDVELKEKGGLLEGLVKNVPVTDGS